MSGPTDGANLSTYFLAGEMLRVNVLRIGLKTYTHKAHVRLALGFDPRPTSGVRVSICEWTKGRELNESKCRGFS